MVRATSHPGAEPNEGIFPEGPCPKGDINKSGTAEAYRPSSLGLLETGFFIILSSEY